MTSNRSTLSRRRLLHLTAVAGITGTGLAASGDRAAAQEYTEVYEETIDDVVLVTPVTATDPADEDDPGAPDPPDPDEEVPAGLGSGFVVDDVVVTNDHVIGDADAVELQFTDEQWRTGDVLGTDDHSDLAVLEVDDLPDGVEGLSLADDEPQVGQEVLALGNPLGLDASVSQGIVSGVDRSLPSPTGFAIPAAIQTDAAVDPGNSGGPLVTLEGDVLGVVFAGAGRAVGFAIPAQLVSRVVPELRDEGEYAHPYLGVGTEPVGPLAAQVNDLEEARGVQVVEIDPNGPADGVLETADEVAPIDGRVIPVGGDVLVAIDDEEIATQERLSTYLALETSPGDEVDLEVIRDGERETVAVTLDERPDVDVP